MSKCGYFGTCGGCSYQDLPYEKQLELKRKMVEEALCQNDNFIVRPTLPSPKPYEYRHMIALSVKKREGALRLGFVAQDGRSFLPIEECPIAEGRINQFLPQALQKLESLPPERRFHTSQVVLRVGSKGDVITSLRPDRGKKLECQVAGKTFSFSMSSFFQNNFSILETFISAIRNMLQSSVILSEAKNLDPSATPQDDKGTLFDLYSGVGLIGISLADAYQQVVGIEEGYEAVQYAKQNASVNGIANATFLEGKVEKLLPELIARAQKPLQVVVDPPRIGLKPEVVDCLNELPIDRLVYVSCHLEALSRDLKGLINRYKIVQVQPVDLFPQTKHIETLVLLEPR